MVIRAIVYAETRADAIEKAREIFDGLTENGHPFDYYALFNDKDSSPVSGKGRYGNIPEVVRADSPDGKKLISDGLDATKCELYENLEHIRKGLAVLTNEDIWNDKDKRVDTEKDELELDAGMLRYFCYGVGQYAGSENFLYDNDGEAIRDPEHLKHALDKWSHHKDAKEEYEGLVIWVVPADVHF